jgi:hypothetical protein
MLLSMMSRLVADADARQAGELGGLSLDLARGEEDGMPSFGPQGPARRRSPSCRSWPWLFAIGPPNTPSFCVA